MPTVRNLQTEQIQPRILAQARPNTVSAISIYSPTDQAFIKRIWVANNGAGNSAFRLYVDDDGTTYDETTALIWDHTLTANTYMNLEVDIPMSNSSGNIAVRLETATALTFHVWGEDIKKVR